MNFKLDMSTKLRLENSALGTYEFDNDSKSATIAKNLTRDKFIGVVLTMSMGIVVTSYIAISVQETKNINGQIVIVVAFANNMTFAYYPETGALTMNTPSSEG